MERYVPSNLLCLEHFEKWWVGGWWIVGDLNSFEPSAQHKAEQLVHNASKVHKLNINNRFPVESSIIN